MKNKIKEMKGFTLVELLIVIALIAILSVAVLATINPIEQSNKAKDSTVQNDAAEVMNAYERYYANAQAYPWMKYGAVKATVDDAILLRSDTLGFGVCDADVVTKEANVKSAKCSPTSADSGLLIKTDELKPAFVGKDEFRTVIDDSHPENALWLYKQAGSGGSVYVCYIPKAKSNRDLTSNQLYCLDSTNKTKLPADGTNCVAPTTTDDTWSTPTFDGKVAMFKCVP